MVRHPRSPYNKNIDDTYPIPNIMAILTNMGKVRYYPTTLDLKYGFHHRKTTGGECKV